MKKNLLLKITFLIISFLFVSFSLVSENRIKLSLNTNYIKFNGTKTTDEKVDIYLDGQWQETYENGFFSYNKQFESSESHVVEIVSANPTIQQIYLDKTNINTIEIGNEPYITYLSCYGNQISELDITGCESLEYLICNDNNISTLDLSGNEILEYLGCQNNLLTRLDISGNILLEWLQCYNNRIPLSDLYIISEQITDPSYKDLGTQTLTVQEAELNQEYIITTDLTLGGINTAFNVKKNDVQAVPDTEYTLADGKITFNVAGNFVVEMTNNAIESSDEYPVIFIAKYEVKKSIESLEVEPIDDEVYTGSEIRPSLVIKDGDYVLTGTDYIPTYYDNTNAGTATIVVEGQNGYSGTQTVYFQITKAEQTINFPELPETNFSVGTLQAAATASSGLPVSYESSDLTVATVNSSGLITFLKAATVDITANQAGNENYEAAASVVRILTIIDDSSALKNNNNLSVSIYPNPVQNTLYVNAPEHGEVMIELYSLTGKLLMQTQLTDSSINLDDFQAGIYMLKVIQNGNQTVHRIVKK